MNRKSIRKSIRAFLDAEDGASTILAIFWFMLFCALGGLAVDITNGFRVQGMMQATADAAAHAAVMDLPDETTAEDRALAYTEINMPADIHGTVLVREDIEIGLWDPNTRTFVAGLIPPNAVRVTLHSTRQTGNSVPTSFLRIIGLDDWNVSVAATAAYSVSGDCFDYYGFAAGGFVESGSENNYDGICIHGEEYVKVGSTNYFGDGTQVSMADLDTLEEGSDNEGLHPEWPEGALLEQSYTPPMVSQVSGIISGLADGSVTPPNFLTRTQHVSSLPSTLEEGTLYIVDGSDDVVIDSDAVVNNIGIVVLDTEKKLLVGSKVSLANVLLAARGNIEVGSENQIGANDFCSTGQGGVFAFTESEYKAGSQSDYSGVQIVAVTNVFLGSELTSAEYGRLSDGLSVQAGQNIYWGSQENFSYGGCKAPSFFSLDGRVAIVN